MKTTIGRLSAGLDMDEFDEQWPLLSDVTGPEGGAGDGLDLQSGGMEVDIAQPGDPDYDQVVDFSLAKGGELTPEQEQTYETINGEFESGEIFPSYRDSVDIFAGTDNASIAALMHLQQKAEDGDDQAAREMSMLREAAEFDPRAASKLADASRRLAAGRAHRILGEW
jgi:hypothetical protein